ncbi:MAG TPA: hypothetical protein VG755_17650 [Nannocystaceae bacterium]|nr:hypothetical protein [Nannocystaceae bacterium]
MPRWPAFLGFAMLACFSESNGSSSSNDAGEASEGSSGSTATTTSAATGDATSLDTQSSSSVDGSTGSIECADGMVRVPGPPPVGWEGWSFVAQGTAMQPPVPCPEGEPDVRFGNATPSCRCECADAFECATSVVAYTDEMCTSVAMGGAALGNSCYALVSPATSLNIMGTSDSGASCDAAGTLLPGPAAIPTSICAAPDDGCVALPDGFAGPCVIGLGAECPGGFVQLTEVDSVSCSVCPPCLQSDVCAARRYDAFANTECAGMPVATIPADGTCAGQGLESVYRAPPDPMAPTGCADATLQLAHQRICCVP